MAATDRSHHHPRRFAHGLVALLLLALTLTQLVAQPTVAQSPGNDTFQRTWERTDQPVAEQSAERALIWGPAADTGLLQEPYAEAPDGKRVVQYFDKGRMEAGDFRQVASPWDVTSGLLVVEMANGWYQIGDDTFDESPEPADIPVAGDIDDSVGPTYRTIGTLLDAPSAPAGQTITTRVDRAGATTDDPMLAQYGATADYLVQVPGIDHRVASVFWTFMNSSGLVHTDGQTETDSLFANPFYATGYPITDAYWATVKVAGDEHDVLLQCFERRCLTWTPSNSDGWQVESGNVGAHYLQWRVGATAGVPVVVETSTSVPTVAESSQPTATQPPAVEPTAPPAPTNTPVPAPPATGWLSVAVVGPNGGIDLPAEAVIDWATVEIFAGSCSGSSIGSYALDTGSFTTGVEVTPGSYCAQLSGSITFQTLSASIFSSGSGTVEAGSGGYITIVVDASSISLQ
ncbi:MAG: peptidase domain-containing protein [Thermomicrobiales bacterium]|nr:peptidase domain-containing protein [Thermomicrobiales bacterium]